MDVDDEKVEKISKAEYARRFGCSRQWVSKLVKSGHLKTDEKGKVIVKLVDKKVNQKVNQVDNFADGDDVDGLDGGDGKSWKDRQIIARTIQNECKAELLKIQVSREQGQVINLERACDIAGEAFETLKNSLLLLPLKLAVMLEMQEARFIEATIETEIRQCLEETVRKLNTLKELAEESPPSDP